jgi:hypothetical protein
MTVLKGVKRKFNKSFLGAEDVIKYRFQLSRQGKRLTLFGWLID